MQQTRQQPISNEADPLISVAQAAEKIGINRSTLARQIKDGAVRSHKGKVRLSEVLQDRAKNIDLTRSGRRDGKSDDTLQSVASAIEAAADAPFDAKAAEAVMVDGKTLSYADARALKETYLAWLKRIEHDILLGKVVVAADVAQAVAQEYGIVRNRMLGIPSKLAARIIHVRKVEEAREMIAVEIHDALAELSIDAADPGTRFRTTPKEV